MTTPQLPSVLDAKGGGDIILNLYASLRAGLQDLSKRIQLEAGRWDARSGRQDAPV